MKDNELGICEWEAIAFFGREHTSRAYGTDWFDSDSVYEISEPSGLKLTFAIHPIHRDVRITLSLNDEKIYDWHAQDLNDICYIEKKDRTIIKIIVNNRDNVTLRVIPKIQITRSTGQLDG